MFIMYIFIYTKIYFKSFTLIKKTSKTSQIWAEIKYQKTPLYN